MASLSLSIGYPTIVSVPHSVVNGFKRLLALAAVTDITFKEAETLKEFLAVSNIICSVCKGLVQVNCFIKECYKEARKMG